MNLKNLLNLIGAGAAGLMGLQLERGRRLAELWTAYLVEDKYFGIIIPLPLERLISADSIASSISQSSDLEVKVPDKIRSIFLSTDIASPTDSNYTGSVSSPSESEVIPELITTTMSNT